MSSLCTHTLYYAEIYELYGTILQTAQCENLVEYKNKQTNKKKFKHETCVLSIFYSVWFQLVDLKMSQSQFACQS